MKQIIAGLSIFAFGLLLLVTATHAETIKITGNGDSASTTIGVTQKNNDTVVQNNSASVTNTLNATANTGNNSAQNNQGNSSVTTGDSTTSIKIINSINNNNASITCCTTPTQTPKPTPTTKPITPTPDPATPTPDPGNPTATPVPSNSSSSNGSTAAGIGGADIATQKNGDVLALAATDGEYDVLRYALQSAGFLCTALGTIILTKKG
jgi:hypothetical protein